MRPARSTIVLFWVVAVAVYLAPRLSGLELDPPVTVLTGSLGTELMVEPPAKAHEARNWALFGAWKLSPVDNYQFWRAQSPAWVYPLALSFKLFGVSYATLRATATLFGLAGLVAVVLFAYRRYGPRGAVLGAVLLSTDQFGIFFGRSGILEPLVAGFCALSLYFLDRAFERVAWLAPALLALLVAIAIKLAALPAIPVVVVFGGVALFRAEGAVRKARIRWIAIVSIGLLFVALGAYALSPAYRRTLEWNFHHMLLAREGGSGIDLEALDDEEVGATATEVLRRFNRLRWMFPIAVVCAGLELARHAYLLVRRRLTIGDALVLAYFVSFALGVFLPRFSGLRFLVLLQIPLVLLTLGFVCNAATWLEERANRWPRLLGRVGPLLFGLGAAAWGLGTWAYARANLGHEVRDTTALLRDKIGDRPDAVVIGLWAAPAVLETPYKHYYVKSVFNSSPEALAALDPTHTLLLESQDYTRSILASQWPDALEVARPLGTVTLRNRPITLAQIPLVARNRLRRQFGLPLVFGRP